LVLAPSRSTDDLWRAVGSISTVTATLEYRQCLQHHREDACNWMVPADDPEPYCMACRLNEVIPNLDKPGNRIAMDPHRTAQAPAGL
jgi:hypothetical protein